MQAILQVILPFNLRGHSLTKSFVYSVALILQLCSNVRFVTSPLFDLFHICDIFKARFLLLEEFNYAKFRKSVDPSLPVTRISSQDAVSHFAVLPDVFIDSCNPSDLIWAHFVFTYVETVAGLKHGRVIILIHDVNHDSRRGLQR